MYDTTPPGTVAGLAWTSMGGSALYVESTVVKTEKDKARGRQNFRDRKKFWGNLNSKISVLDGLSTQKYRRSESYR